MSTETTNLHDSLAEQAVIASLLSGAATPDDISPIITQEDFFEPRNEIIFSVITQLQEHGRSFDPIAVNAELNKQGLSNVSGGIGYLMEILSPTSITTYSSDPIAYSHLVKDLSQRRQLVNLSQEFITNATLGSGLSGVEAVESAEASLMDAIHQTGISTVQSAADLLDSAFVRIEEAATMAEGAVRGISTGFPMLDELTTGFHGSQVTLVGARPAVGKSAIALDFARAGAYLAGKSVLFFSLEMTTEELMKRLLSAEARVPLQNIAKGRLTQEERMNLDVARERIKTGSLFFDVTAEVGLSHIRSRAIRQQISPSGLDLIIVDYLQLMQVPPGNKNSTRENQVSALSRGIKLLAKQLNVPIILLSQLNRNSETRADKKPAMSDLRESGAIEQDMDVIFLLHRPEQSDPNLRPGEADLIIAKNRHGPTSTVPLVPTLQFSKFMPGEGEIPRDDSVYEATDAEGNRVYEPPTEADETPW